jgi:hypothetical protein
MTPRRLFARWRERRRSRRQQQAERIHSLETDASHFVGGSESGSGFTSGNAASGALSALGGSSGGAGGI